MLSINLSLLGQSGGHWPKSNLLMLGAFLFLFLSGCSASEKIEDLPAHHKADGTFVNTDGKAISKSFTDLIRWRWNQTKPEPYAFEVLQPDLALISSPEQNQITWIGHSTFLLQLDGQNILTDPHFTERASPSSYFGPKRVVPPALTLDQLPHIDAVIISHNHYDHMDEGSLVDLFARQTENPPQFYVPLGLKKDFNALGINTVVELDWWNMVNLNGLTFTALPVKHWSQRGLFDRNETLWAGWMIDSPTFRFFHVGDSGYSSDFKKIGACFPNIDLAAIPIGAYDPRWFMKDGHMDPAEAVQVFKDLNATQAVGMHWGTFILTDEEMTEPPRLLNQALIDNGLSRDDFSEMQHGEIKKLPISMKEKGSQCLNYI